MARCRRQGAMRHFITGVDLHIGGTVVRVHIHRAFRRAGRNWLYTAAHKTRQVIIGGIFRTAVPYWPRVRRVLYARRWFTGRVYCIRRGFLSFFFFCCAISITIGIGFSALKNRRFSTSLERNVRHDERFMLGTTRHYLISN